MVFYIGKMQIVEVLFLFISKMLYLYTHKVKLKYDSDRKLQIEEIYGLDPTDEKQRWMATAYLLEKVSWTGMSEFKVSLTASRTRQLFFLKSPRKLIVPYI